ncbi:MAG TPA: hypothetical protein PLW48_03300 [Alphaproteobacteria bacterium]|nr:hypothetical protein [Alphaproteobacteria bacterium]HCS24053.1 hypothetical protein [Rhodospirillaceae bacterium]HRI76447.1 hypothetical protein [Alphaproteobacteria bacterium]HRJ66136.1 hypothetical protein [Alphaproteobacteria bacterium]
MANENTFKESKLKSAFQGVVGGLYAAIGEDPNMGMQTAGYVYDRAKLAKDQAVQGLKTKFA